MEILVTLKKKLNILKPSKNQWLSAMALKKGLPLLFILTWFYVFPFLSPVEAQPSIGNHSGMIDTYGWYHVFG
ncbi:MAG: hypothetical protein QXT81_06770, partial [Candidatus Bathyarchaeia archaeon]